MGSRTLSFVSHRWPEALKEVEKLFLFLWVPWKIVLIPLMNALTWGDIALLSCHVFQSLLVTSLLVGTENLINSLTVYLLSARVMRGVWIVHKEKEFISITFLRYFLTLDSVFSA